MPIINSHNSWSQLEEVWLGDVYPTSWYDHLSPEVRDCFYEITERTKQDLDYIQKLLESFGVRVSRPEYNSIDDYVNWDNGQLIKPEICPRDYYLTVGDCLFAQKNKNQASPWQTHIDRYRSAGGRVENTLSTQGLCLSGANCVRAGKDLYFDLVWLLKNNPDRQFIIEFFKIHFAPYFSDYRLHVMFNGGHVDSCFALLKPGLILGSSYFNDYEKTFPGWDVWNIWQPEFNKHNQRRSSTSPIYNGKWYLPGINNRAFNNHVIEHALDWIGDYTETFFEINCLVVNEKNVIIPGENTAVFRALEQRGITAHSVPFRTRTFWDGGMHCITLDIRRQSKIEDYFPDRTENLYVY